MKVEEFRAWLGSRRWRGKALTLKGIQNRLGRLRRVERSLRAMGLDAADLDEVIGRGELQTLLEKLKSYIGSSDGPPANLVPWSGKPDRQLHNLQAATRLYGKFAAGEDPNAHDPDGADADDEWVKPESEADRIRTAALKRYIEPARQRGDLEVMIRAGDLHDALGLKQAHANVCQAIGGAKFQRIAGVPPPRSEGPKNSTTTTFHYRISLMAAGDGAQNLMQTKPTNLIFFGPPGTGKTYRTAFEAVRLCDGTAAEDRVDLMQRYGELEREGRIGFVTFHQSFSYEEFVEGLRPETPVSELGSSAGFRLEPRKGVFREMAALADQACKAAAAPQRAGGLDLAGRRFWKMGLGEIGVEDHVYAGAIAKGYIVLGWGGDVDWSDPVYQDLAAVRSKWDEVGPPDSKPSNVSQLWPFRSEMKKGDIVIVPYGNTAFRAIGEVTGDYTFVATGEAGWNHRRAVNWLLVLDTPLPLDSIVEGAFTMRTLYSIDQRRIRVSTPVVISPEVPK